MFVHTRTPVADDGDAVTFPADAGANAANVSISTPGTSPLGLRVSYVAPQVAVLSAAGDLDLATTPRLAELVWPRLQATLSAVIVDLSDLRFLGVSGLELLARAHSFATHRGMAFSVVTHTRAVDRALNASGLDGDLLCFATVAAACVAAGHGRNGNTSDAEQERSHAGRAEMTSPGTGNAASMVVQP